MQRQTFYRLDACSERGGRKSHGLIGLRREMMWVIPHIVTWCVICGPHRESQVWPTRVCDLRGNYSEQPWYILCIGLELKRNGTLLVVSIVLPRSAHPGETKTQA